MYFNCTFQSCWNLLFPSCFNYVCKVWFACRRTGKWALPRSGAVVMSLHWWFVSLNKMMQASGWHESQCLFKCENLLRKLLRPPPQKEMWRALCVWLKAVMTPNKVIRTCRRRQSKGRLTLSSRSPVYPPSCTLCHCITLQLSARNTGIIPINPTTRFSCVSGSPKHVYPIRP